MDELLKILGHHQVWTAIIGIVTGLLAIWTFYKDFWEGPAIKVHAPDSIDLVKSQDCVTRKLHIACTFTNTSRKAGIVPTVAVLLKPAKAKKWHLFKWNMFFSYQGGHRALPDSKVCPIPVASNSSTLQGIEFQTSDQIEWNEGEYNVRLLAWSEGKRLSLKTSSSDDFSIVLSNGFVADLLRKETMDRAGLRTVMIAGRDVGPALKEPFKSVI